MARSKIYWDILSAALLDENHYPNGKVNWDYVASDVCIDLGDRYDTKWICEEVEKEAEKYEKNYQNVHANEHEWDINDELNHLIVEATDGTCSLSHTI